MPAALIQRNITLKTISNGTELRFAHMVPRLAEPGISQISMVRKISQYRRHRPPSTIDFSANIRRNACVEVKEREGRRIKRKVKKEAERKVAEATKKH